MIVITGNIQAPTENVGDQFKVAVEQWSGKRLEETGITYSVVSSKNGWYKLIVTSQFEMRYIAWMAMIEIDCKQIRMRNSKK